MNISIKNKTLAIIAVILGISVTLTSAVPVSAAEALSSEVSSEAYTVEDEVTQIAQTAATTAFADAIATGKEEDVALYEAKKAANSEVERLTGEKVVEPEAEDQMSENSDEASDDTDDEDEITNIEETADSIENANTSVDTVAGFADDQASLTAIERASSVSDCEIVVSEEELKLLATIIYCEAGNQSHTGKVAVGNVVLNRLKSERFPNTLNGVIYQRGQFSPAGSGWLGRELKRNKVTADCYTAAEEALQGSTPVGSSLFFMRKELRSRGIIIGAHCFW